MLLCPLLLRRASSAYRHIPPCNLFDHNSPQHPSSHLTHRARQACLLFVLFYNLQSRSLSPLRHCLLNISFFVYCFILSLGSSHYQNLIKPLTPLLGRPSGVQLLYWYFRPLCLIRNTPYATKLVDNLATNRVLILRLRSIIRKLPNNPSATNHRIKMRSRL